MTGAQRGDFEAPPSPDPDEVERVARALLDEHEVDLDLPERWQWDDASDGVRAYFRRLARAALAAVRPATELPPPFNDADGRRWEFYWFDSDGVGVRPATDAERATACSARWKKRQEIA